MNVIELLCCDMVASRRRLFLLTEANIRKNGVSCPVALFANSNHTKHDMLQATRDKVSLGKSRHLAIFQPTGRLVLGKMRIFPQGTEPTF